MIFDIPLKTNPKSFQEWSILKTQTVLKEVTHLSTFQFTQTYVKMRSDNFTFVKSAIEIDNDFPFLSSICERCYH